MEAINAFALFIGKWTNPKYPPTPVAEADLLAVERKYGIVFPQDYLDCVTRHGAPNTVLAFLSSVIHSGTTLPDISGFHTPDAMLGTDSLHAGGLPDHLIPFADDCAGNMLCFVRRGGDIERPATAPVWFFDHDRMTSEEISPSFAELIEFYGTIPFNDAEV